MFSTHQVLHGSLHSASPVRLSHSTIALHVDIHVWCIEILRKVSVLPLPTPGHETMQNNNYSTRQDIGRVFLVVGFNQPNVYIDIVIAATRLLLSNNCNLRYGLSNMGTVNIWENRARIELYPMGDIQQWKQPILPAHQLIRLLHCGDAHTVELVYYRNGNVEGVVNDIAAHPVKCDIHTHTQALLYR